MNEARGHLNTMEQVAAIAVQPSRKPTFTAQQNIGKMVSEPYVAALKTNGRCRE